MIAGTPRPSSPTQPPRTPAELDLGGGQRARAELVLEPLELHPRAALHQEAGEAARRLGQHEEHVARRIGAEPLVAVELVAPVPDRLGAGDVGAHVGAALALGHRHPRQRAALVVGQGEARLPLGGQLGSAVAQRRHGGVGHRHRAHDAVVGVAPQREQRRADDVGAGLGLAPRQAVDPARHRPLQQPVPRRIELDGVDPVAEAIVGGQPRLVALGAAGVLARLDAAGDGAGLAGALGAPAPALAVERLLEREVELEQVGGLKRRRLIEHLARRVGDLDRGHVISLVVAPVSRFASRGATGGCRARTQDPTCSPATRGSEDNAWRRQACLECERTCGRGHQLRVFNVNRDSQA